MWYFVVLNCIFVKFIARFFVFQGCYLLVLSFWWFIFERTNKLNKDVHILRKCDLLTYIFDGIFCRMGVSKNCTTGRLSNLFEGLTVEVNFKNICRGHVLCPYFYGFWGKVNLYKKKFSLPGANTLSFTKDFPYQPFHGMENPWFY